MLAEIIPKIAEQFNEEHEYYPRPSLAGPDRCIRQMVYHGLKVPRQPLPGRAVLVFDDSSWHEELTADWIRKSAYKLHSEQMQVQAGCLLGHIDGIITDPQAMNLDGSSSYAIDYLWEHKAINHFTFQKYWNGEIPTDYVYQVCLYLRGLQDVNADISTAILLIKNKNTSAYLEYRIVYETATDLALIICRQNSQGEVIPMDLSFPDIKRKSFEKFAQVAKYILSKTLPKRQYDMDHWRCEYCGWGELCWEGYEEEFKELATEQALSEEINTLVKYRQELGAQHRDIENEYKDITAQVIKLMKDKETRQGKTTDYTLEILMRHREETVMKATKWEQLSVKKREVKK